MARVIYLGGLYRAEGSGMARAAAEAVLGARNTPAFVAGAPRIRHKRDYLAQKGTARLGVLTEARIEQCRCAGAPVLMEGGGERVGARERVLQWSEQRAAALGRSGRRGGAGALLGRGSGVAEWRGRGGAGSAPGGAIVEAALGFWGKIGVGIGHGRSRGQL